MSSKKVFGCSLIATALVLSLTGCGRSSLFASCEELVKNELKSPASAQFSGETQSNLDSSTVNIDGTVDSQNGFGAMIRSTFECQASGSDLKLMWVN
jgi:hypothetical protein